MSLRYWLKHANLLPCLENFNLFLFRLLLSTQSPAYMILRISKRRLVRDTNAHKFFSALNLMIIFIKPFTCNNTIFILLQSKIISQLNFFFKANYHYHLLLDGSLTQPEFVSDIPS